MKSKKPRRKPNHSLPDGSWVDVDDLVKPGETKRVTKNLSVVNSVLILDPPEPIRKHAKNKTKKKSA